MGTGLPQKVMVKHRYVHSWEAEATTGGAFNTVTYKANGMFAPSVTNIGTPHQPMYFDQYAALYNHFCVIGSKITFKLANRRADENVASFRYCCYLDDNNTVNATNIDAICEATQGRPMTVVSGDSTDTHIKTLKFSAKRIFGKSVLGNKELTGTPAADPSELSYFIIGLQANPGESFHVSVTAEIEYIAIWTELKEVVQS